MSTQLEAAMTLTTLEELVARARARPGYLGVAVWDQAEEPYPNGHFFTAGCMAKDGEMCPPRSDNDHARIEDALADLAAVMDRSWGVQS